MAEKVTYRQKSWNQVILAMFLFVFTLLAASSSYASSDECQTLLTRKPGTRAYYIEKYQQTHKRAVQVPRFVDPIEEMQLSKGWTGELAPGVFDELLPEGVTLVGHRLREASGEGVVKLKSPGEYVVLRATVPWKGREVSMNIGLNLGSLLGNLGRKDKWLVGPEADAAIDWGHGGGTKSTGHHTAFDLINYFHRYNVAVVGMDQPWHAEGARIFFEGLDDYESFRAAFVKKYIHPDVPAINMGHSMGGIFADLFMRQSHKPEFKDVYAGYIAMAPVPDPLPGGSLEDKLAEDQRRWEEQQKPEVNLRISPEDRGLEERMIRENKVSPVAMMFAQQMDFFNDWSIPEHRGKEWKPILYIAGSRDSLTVGKEDLFEEYIRPLENAQLEFIDSGHLFFNIFREETGEMEVFARSREFIEQVIGKELVRNNNSSNIGPLIRAFQIYANDLSFREFIKDYKVQVERPTERFKEVKTRMEQIGRYAKFAAKFLSRVKQDPAYAGLNVDQSLEKERQRIRAALAEGSLKEAHESQLKDELAMLTPTNEGGDVLSHEEALALKDDLKEILARQYVPDGPMADEARKNIEARVNVSRELTQLEREEKKALDKKLAQLHYEKDVLLAKIEQGLNESAPKLLAEEHRALEDFLRNQLRPADLEVRDRGNEYFLQLIDQGRLTAENLEQFPDDLRDTYKKYSTLSDEYQDRLAEFKAKAMEEARVGRLGQELQDLVIEYSGQDGQSGLKQQIAETVDSIHEIEERVWELREQREELSRVYFQDIIPGYFEVSEVRLWDLLLQGHSGEVESILQQAMGRWKSDLRDTEG